MKQISNSFVGVSGAHSLRALAPLGIFAKSLTGVVGNSGRACFSIFALLFANFTICNVTSALSISVPQTISFDIVSGKANHSEAATIEVLSNDALAGYTLTLSGSDTLDASVSANGSLGATAKNTSDENEFDSNTWGLKYCNLSDNSDCITSTNYKATSSTEALQIDKTAVNNSQPIKYALAIGAKTSSDIKADTYSNTFTLASVANLVYHSVGFVDWTENIPDAIAGTGTTINIPSNIPTKPGYKFKGWCPTKKALLDSCDQPLIAPGTSSYSLATEEGVAYTNLYAIWDYADTCEGYMIMQNIANWKNALNVGDLVTACDNRDHKLYNVGKLADNNIWMLDNLAFVPKNNTTLTPEDTNIKTDTTVTNWTWVSPSSSYETPLISTKAISPTILPTIDDTDSGLDIATTVNWKYGAYYNFAAASAGKYIYPYEEGTGNADEDICPKDWRLPAGNSSDNEFSILSALYSDDYRTFREKLHLPLSGDISDGDQINYSGVGGYFWGSALSGRNSMVFLHVNSSNANTSGGWRTAGLSIRCIAK